MASRARHFTNIKYRLNLPLENCIIILHSSDSFLGKWFWPREGRMHKKRLFIGGIVVVVVLGLIAGAMYFGLHRIPPVADQVGAKNQLAISIISPPNDSRYPADAAIPIAAIAQGLHPIASVEYWVDGVLLRTDAPSTGHNSTYDYQTWSWMPIVEGDHAVTFRVKDSQGNTATSNILTLHVDKAAGYRISHTTTADDTWQGLTRDCATSLDAIAKQNPDLNTQQPLSAGQKVWIPCGPIIPSVKPPAQNPTPVPQNGPSAPASPPGKLGFWVQANTGKLPLMSAAPGLAAGLDGCSVRLSIKDNSSSESGFMVYRSGASDFERIATLGANSTDSFTYADTVQQNGKVQYYVSAFGTAGETPSNIVAVTVPDGACAPAKNPAVQYANGILSVGQGMDLAYAYVSLDKGPWQRLPEGDGFFRSEEPLLKVKPFTRLADLQVWGWSGGAIKDLGPLQVTLAHTTLDYCSIPGPTDSGCAQDFSSNWSEQDGEVASNVDLADQSITFQFITNTVSTRNVLVQIAIQPFTANYQPNPPYLVQANIISGYGSSSGSRGEFVIPFNTLGLPKSNMPFSILPQTNFWNLFNPSAPASPSFFDQNLLQQMNQWSIPPGMWNALGTTAYYIRVIPWKDGQPVGAISNTLKLTYKPVKQTTVNVIAEQPAIFSIKITNFNAEQQIDPASFGCVTITDIDVNAFRAWLQANNGEYLNYVANYWSSYNNPYGTANPWSPFYDPNTGNMISEDDWINQKIAAVEAQIQNHDVLCPETYSPDDDQPSFFGELWDAISSSWNAVVDLYNTLKNGIVEAVATAINGLFPGTCDTGCRNGLMDGLNFAITYFTGIPPNLPTTDQLVSDGMDYAIDAALQDSGVDVCDSTCRGVIKDSIHGIVQSLQHAQSQPACFAGGSNSAMYGKKAMCLPDGLTTEPIDGGAYRAPDVQVLVSRVKQVIIGSARQYKYSVQVTSNIVNSSMVGQDFMCPGNGFGYVNGQFAEGYWKLPVPETAQGTPYLVADIPIPSDVAAGTQFTLPIILKADKDNGYMYPPYQAMTGQPNSKLSENSAHYCSYRLLTTPSYQITLQAQLMCTDMVTGDEQPCPATDEAITGDTQTYTP